MANRRIPSGAVQARRWLHLICSLLLSAMSFMVHAEEAPAAFNGDLDVYSDYIGRGLTFSNEKPVIQARLEYDFARSFYAGTALTDKAIVLNKETVEYDLYAGYRRQWNDWSIDVGGITWLYPHSRLDGSNNAYNIVEGTVDVSYKLFGVKIWCDVHDYLGLNSLSARSNYGVAPNGPSSLSTYVDGHWSVPVGQHIAMKLHLGEQFIHNYPRLNYLDWLIGAELSLKFNLTLGAAWTDTNADAALYTYPGGPNLARSKVVGYLRWSFP